MSVPSQACSQPPGAAALQDVGDGIENLAVGR
jgi:hypothetical protein